MKKIASEAAAYTPAVPRSGSRAISRNPGATRITNGSRPFQAARLGAAPVQPVRQVEAYRQLGELGGLEGADPRQGEPALRPVGRDADPRDEDHRQQHEGHDEDR